MHASKRLSGLAAALALFASTAVAQMPESYREVQLRMLQLQRRMLLAMVDSMPERLYRDQAAPGQRDFAQQIGHAAGAAALIIGRFIGGTPPSLPDTATAYASRAGLRAYVNAAFDHAEQVLRSQSAAEREEVVPFFRLQLPRWQIWDEVHMHTVWTAGQVVANFRKHGMRPPGFGFF
jgi:hypothetical protein